MLRNLLPFAFVLIGLIAPLSMSAQSPTCDIPLIMQTFTGAGYVPLAVQGQPCSLYFVNPTSQPAANSQANAAALGANMVVMNDAGENAAVTAALNASGYAGATIWIGVQRTGAGQNTWYTSDGTSGTFPPNNADPNVYQNWAGGEPNNSGYGDTDIFGGCDSECQNGEQCVQIYADGGWNDLDCSDNSISVIEVNLCPELTLATDGDNICAGNPVNLSATTLLGSVPYSYSWDTGQNGANIAVTPSQTTTYTATVTDRYACSAQEPITITTLASATSDFTADASACEGLPATITYAGTGLAGSTYTWGFDGGVPVSGSGQGPYQVAWAAAGVKNVTLTVTEAGCVSPITTVQITVEASPTADFTFTTECEGTATVFTNTSTGNIAGSAWDFGGAPVISTDATFTFPNAGTFAVSMGVSTIGGCIDQITQQVTVNPLPVADFTTPDVCLGEVTPFTDGSSISSGTIATYDWDFGDGSANSAQTDPTHTYAAANSYDVVLTVTSDQNCTATVTNTVIVGVNPVADFTIVDACDGDAVQFFDASTVSAGVLTDWDWDFGDGDASTLQDPTHTYNGPGTYDVTLIANSGSCTATVTYQATVFESPTADFTTANVCLGEPADFFDNSSVNGGVITTWAWDFAGEGNAFTPDASFTFPNAGTFSVTLAVVTADLCAATYTEDIIIYPTPVADFTAAAVCEGNATQFTNTSTVSSGVISINAWDFGDMGASANASPTHTYAASGTYTVSLGVSTAFGCLGTTTQDVDVNPLPAIDASHTNILCASQTNGTATAVASGAAAPYDYQWNNTLQSTTPSIQNLSAGPYTVTVTDALGCESDTTVIVAQPLPINVNMVAGDDTCLYGNGAVQAVMLGGTAPFTYVWSAIRDSTYLYSTVNPPSGWNTGLSPGDYSVVVTDAGGCSIEGTASVGVIPPPVAIFSTRSKPEELMDPAVEFFNQSTASLTYQWNLGDGNVDMAEHPVHAYDSAGIYLVMLIAYNEPRYGCSDTAYRYVEVEPLFTFYVPNSFTPDGDDINDLWGPKGDNFEYESYNAQIYDRWGTLLWQTDNPLKQWDGNDPGSLEPVKDGVYIYRFVLKQFNTFEPRQITGSVKLYRNY